MKMGAKTFPYFKNSLVGSSILSIGLLVMPFVRREIKPVSSDSQSMELDAKLMLSALSCCINHKLIAHHNTFGINPRS